MLSELRIRDFAIIDELDLSFNPGFVVFTGETGAGKSIIIDAVELLLGGRAESTMVRTGTETALIEGTFRLDDPVRREVHTILEREGLLEDPDFLILSREIRREGRNICRANGRTVNLALLRELGEWLVDVHGQSEHLSLLRVREHLNLLDRYAQVEGLREEYRQVYQQLHDVRRELQAIRQREKDAARRADLLSFQIGEIEAASLQPGEVEELRAERARLANAEQLVTLAEEAVTALDESPYGRESLTDLLGRATQALSELADVDASMVDLRTAAQALVEQASEIARRLRVYREEIEFNPRRLDEVEERLGLIRSLERKYGQGIETILEHARQARQELESITHAEERLQALEAKEASLLQQLGEIGVRLSQERQRSGAQLRETIAAELEDLHMPGAQFDVDLTWNEDLKGAPVGERRIAFHARGLDRAEFLVAPNPGEGLKPLTKIASGGETSRMMLGLKSVLAKADRTPTLIFDEIDQGIGGRVGAVVGQKLWGLTHSHQVLCVTHLPQLAAFGDQHFKVEKRTEKGRTVTLAHDLSRREKIPELALMLGGASETNMESATDLLQKAAQAKEADKVG